MTQVLNHHNAPVCIIFFFVKGWWEGRSEVLHQSVLLFWPVEGEDAAGHRGQEEGEAETESKCEQTRARCPSLQQCWVFGHNRLRFIWWTLSTGGGHVDGWTESFLRSPQIHVSGWTGRFSAHRQKATVDTGVSLRGKKGLLLHPSINGSCDGIICRLWGF